MAVHLRWRRSKHASQEHVTARYALLRIVFTSASFNGRPVTGISFEYSSGLRFHKIVSVIHAEDTKTRTSVISEQNKLVGFMYLMRGQHWVGVAGVEVTGTLGEVETKNS